VDFADNAVRFGVLAAAALDFAECDSGGRPVDVVHAHDWQAGLVAVLLRTSPERYQQLRQAGLVFDPQPGVSRSVSGRRGANSRRGVSFSGRPEFYGKFSFLKSGLTWSDYLTL
jgi:starch synthase